MQDTGNWIDISHQVHKGHKVFNYSTAVAYLTFIIALTCCVTPFWKRA